MQTKDKRTPLYVPLSSVQMMTCYGSPDSANELAGCAARMRGKGTALFQMSTPITQKYPGRKHEVCVG